MGMPSQQNIKNRNEPLSSIKCRLKSNGAVASQEGHSYMKTTGTEVYWEDVVQSHR